MKLIDTHCHLYNDKIDNGLVLKLIEEADELEKVVLMGTNLDKSQENLTFAQSCAKAYVCVGIHPEEINDNWKNELIEIEKLLDNKKVVGIGEIGLDYHYTKENALLQQKVLISQLKLAHKHGLPVCIHTRDSAQDLYKILSDNKNLIDNGCVIHCFSESADWAQKFVDLGCFISFCGNFTFKNYNQSVANVIPVERVMIETDSPYLSPVPHRGEVNNPTRVVFVAEGLAKVWGLSLSDVAFITTQNAKSFYKRMN